MNKKIFCISAFLIFILLLSSCTSGLPTEPEILTDKELVIEAIENFCSALSAKEWDLARSYCVYQAYTYNAIFKLEMDVNDWLSSECDSITIIYWADISNVDIDGDNAVAYGYLTDIIICDNNNEEEDKSKDVTISLKKIGERWKIYQ
ncbi:MAG: hypothetical protein WAW45_04755 [Atribacterota bacterium]